MKKNRKILYIISALSALLALYLSFETEIKTRDGQGSETRGAAVSISVDSGIDGGAAGFAILSGLALVAASITLLHKEE